MKILIIGGGGREHALAWKLAQSPAVKGLFSSPGNPGIAKLAQCIPAPSDVSGYADMAQAHGIHLTIVGPEAPLMAGIVDHFYRRRLKIIGPTQAAARLEGSKIFAKEFFERASIPTGKSILCASQIEALDAIKNFSFPLVVKADGLAAGKGVIIANDFEQASAAIAQLGPALVIEEFLVGEEVSYIGLSNGSFLIPFAPSQDHKRIFDGDSGPNTGGMGAYADSRILTAEQSSNIMEAIMLPALAQMRKENNPFTGFLYAGIMLTAEGPRVLEFNVRLGDPETQALMHTFQGDFAEILGMAVNGIGTVSRRAWSQQSVCVVLAADGYPGTPKIGDAITGIDDAEATGATVFHAGTKLADETLVTNGGRVLGVTAGGDNLDAAIRNAYAAVEKIRFHGMQYRTDIGQKGLNRYNEIRNEGT